MSAPARPSGSALTDDDLARIGITRDQAHYAFAVAAAGRDRVTPHHHARLRALLRTAPDRPR